jgi:hypothetical protein
MITTDWYRNIVYGALGEYVNGFLPATIPATLSVDTAMEVVGRKHKHPLTWLLGDIH